MQPTLDAYLNTIVATASEPLRAGAAEIVRHLAVAASRLRSTINQGVLGAAFADERGAQNADGDRQRDLDVFADETFLGAMRKAPVALYASEELEQPVILDRGAPLALAIDPLDDVLRKQRIFQFARHFVGVERDTENP